MQKPAKFAILSFYLSLTLNSFAADADRFAAVEMKTLHVAGSMESYARRSFVNLKKLGLGFKGACRRIVHNHFDSVISKRSVHIF